MGSGGSLHPRRMLPITRSTDPPVMTRNPAPLRPFADEPHLAHRSLEMTQGAGGRASQCSIEWGGGAVGTRLGPGIEHSGPTACSLAWTIHEHAHQTSQSAAFGGVRAPGGTLRNLASSTTLQGRLRPRTRKAPPGTELLCLEHVFMNSPG